MSELYDITVFKVNNLDSVMFTRFVLDMESTPRIALRTVDTNICLRKILQSNSDGKNVSPDVISGSKACSVTLFSSETLPWLLTPDFYFFKASCLF